MTDGHRTFEMIDIIHVARRREALCRLVVCPFTVCPIRWSSSDTGHIRVRVSIVRLLTAVVWRNISQLSEGILMKLSTDIHASREHVLLGRFQTGNWNENEICCLHSKREGSIL